MLTDKWNAVESNAFQCRVWVGQSTRQLVSMGIIEKGFKDQHGRLLECVVHHAELYVSSLICGRDIAEESSRVGNLRKHWHGVVNGMTCSGGEGALYYCKCRPLPTHRGNGRVWQ